MKLAHKSRRARKGFTLLELVIATALLSLVLSCLPATAYAGSSVRYALIVGNNRGNNPDVALDTLHHAAEQMAKPAVLGPFRGQRPQQQDRPPGLRLGALPAQW